MHEVNTCCLSSRGIQTFLNLMTDMTAHIQVILNMGR